MIVTMQQYERVLEEIQLIRTRGRRRKLPGKTDHQFWLRKDWQVNFRLPSDLTHREAERLCEAIRTFVI